MYCTAGSSREPLFNKFVNTVKLKILSKIKEKCEKERFVINPTTSA